MRNSQTIKTGRKRIDFRLQGKIGENRVCQVFYRGGCFIERFKDLTDLLRDRSSTAYEIASKRLTSNLCDFAVAQGFNTVFVEVKTTEKSTIEQSLFDRAQLVRQLNAWSRGALGYYTVVVNPAQTIHVFPWDRVFQWFGERSSGPLEGFAEPSVSVAFDGSLSIISLIDAYIPLHRDKIKLKGDTSRYGRYR